MIDIRPATAPVETVTPIKPSEAIRLGCLIRPVQAEGGFFRPGAAACALGALVLGYGYDGPQDESGDANDPFGFANRHLPLGKAVGPEGSAFAGTRSDFSDLIYMLNDYDGWTRERIADWLEGLGL